MAADPAIVRVSLRTLGCKVNRAESETMARALLAAGVRVVERDAEADVVIINTCTVTGEADAKARKEVRRALDRPGSPTVVVTGCLAAMDPESLSALGAHVRVEADKARLPERVAAMAGPAPPGTTPSVAFETAAPSGAPGVFRTRVAVKVQDGCDHRCAFCIVPDARGLPRSVPIADVVGHVEDLAATGTLEVVLTGINIGRYADGGRDLADLVTRVAATAITRVRISSIEPMDLTQRLVDRLAAARKVMPHLHVPLQSGSDRVLAAMRRGYDARGFTAVLARAREALPGLAVTTDVIAGFPGETDDDHRRTLECVRECALSRLHVFRYSRRTGTPAAEMDGQVPPVVSAARARELRELSSALASRHAAGRIGTAAELLVERVAGRTVSGTSEDHLRVSARVPGARVGDVVRVLLTDSSADGMRGVPLL